MEEQTAVAESKARKPRSEAQMEAFKKAVDKLKEKREIEREAKSRARAELDLKKVEAKAEILKERVTKKPKEDKIEALPEQHTSATMAMPPAPMSAQFDMTQVMKQFEQILDQRLPKAKQEVQTATRQQLPTSQRAEPSSLSHYGTPPAWYDSMFKK